MADDTKNGTLRSRGKLGTNQLVANGRLTVQTSTVAVTAAASANSVYTMMRIPSTARIHGLSRISWDDLASTGSPTLDVGFAAVSSNITSDPDALNDGLDCATSASNASLVKDIANYGKMAWEYVNGQTSDPGGFLDLTVKILDADTNTGGDITVELVMSTDG